jgi:hypothetical protein
MTNDEIKSNIATIAKSIVVAADKKTLPLQREVAEGEMLAAGVELLANVLQNLNDVADAAREYQRLHERLPTP